MTDYQIKKQSKLHDSWSFWYQPRGKKAHTDPTNYIYHLRHIAGCATAEEFFQLYTYLKRPSEIPVDNKVLFFRKNCKPLWEEWPHGGCWIMMVNKKAAVEINRRWEALLLACIGEQFEMKQVIGIVLSIREKKNLIEVWTRTTDLNIKKAIGEKIRQLLDIDFQNLTFYFKDNESALGGNTSLKSTEKYTFIKTPMETPLTMPEKHNEIDPYVLE